MATIDLGKIKFNWRGTYAGGTAYVPDDVVYYMDGSVGSSYMCVANTTGNAPSSGGTLHASWEYLAKGQATSPTTTQGDIIVRGASADGRLAIGSAGQFVKVNSGASGLEYGTVNVQYDQFAIFELHDTGSNFRCYNGVAGVSGSQNNHVIQWNQVFDHGSILASSSSNTWSVTASGTYMLDVHFANHRPGHWRAPYIYNDGDSKAVGSYDTNGNLTAGAFNFVGYVDAQDGAHTFGERYYLETGKTYSFRWSCDGNMGAFGTGTSYLLANHAYGGVTMYNTVFRARLSKINSPG